MGSTSYDFRASWLSIGRLHVSPPAPRRGAALALGAAGVLLALARARCLEAPAPCPIAGVTGLRCTASDAAVVSAHAASLTPRLAADVAAIAVGDLSPPVWAAQGGAVSACSGLLCDLDGCLRLGRCLQRI